MEKIDLTVANAILQELITLNNVLKGKNELIFVKKACTQKKHKGGKKTVQKGSISKRNDGRWMGRYYNVEKKQVSIYAKTKAECQKALKKAIELEEERKKHKTDSPYADMLYKDWFEIWFKKYKIPTIKESTAIITRNIYKSSVSNDFLNKSVCEITSDDVNNLISKINVKGKKKNLLSLLKESFQKLCDLNVLKLNPVAEIVIPKDFEIKELKEKASSKAITYDEEKIILEQIKDDEVKKVFIFAINTGMRIGEILGLTVGDIDFKNKTISVNKQYNITTQKISTVKSKSGNRVIPLFKKVEDLLTETNVNKMNANETIFKTKYNNVHYVFKMIKNKTNIVFTPHTLRKTFSSRCQLEMNIPIKIVQEWLGHEDSQITDKYYTFINSDESKKYIEKYNNHLSDNRHTY